MNTLYFVLSFTNFFIDCETNKKLQWFHRQYSNCSCLEKQENQSYHIKKGIIPLCNAVKVYGQMKLGITTEEIRTYSLRPRAAMAMYICELLVYIISDRSIVQQCFPIMYQETSELV